MKGDLLSTLLEKTNYIPKDVLREALSYAKTYSIDFATHLISQGYISRDQLGHAIAEYYKVPYVDLGEQQAHHDLTEKISASFAKKHRVIFFREDSSGCVVATDEPGQKGLAALLKKELKTKQPLTIAYSLTADVDFALLQYRRDIQQRLSKIISQSQRVIPELMKEIITEALVTRASDIHIEPREREVIIRYRVDGVLRESGVVSKTLHDNIVNWCKVQAQLRIDEHFTPQDGSMRIDIENRKIDMRLSLVPTVRGEKIAMRLLAQYAQQYSFDDLGISKHHAQMLQRSLSKPFGMILVTGPTGSGKTTTLYACLKTLATPERNITTIEDPVEYTLEGVNQIQVHEKAGLTFAKGLRSIVRQDPNVILVGEIRDTETAEIAVNAALTGHLLLSTFHANDAITTIPRLLDMGIEPFLLASTLDVIIAQRLVRAICDTCKTSTRLTKEDLSLLTKEHQKYFGSKHTTVFVGKGCDACNHTGYRGRVALHEMLYVTSEIEDAIMNEPTKERIGGIARSQGFAPMFLDGIEKVQSGVTTLSEVLRVAPQE